MAKVSLTAPASAEEGASVRVSVTVTNTLGYHSSFETEIFAGVTRIFRKSEIILDGDSKTYSASFTMPADDITVLAWVERWVTDHWAYYGSDSESVALYTPPPTTYHLSVSVPSGGSISPGSGDYPAYSTITLRAYPDSGYEFDHWGGDASGTSRTYNLYMNSDKNVVAYFERVPVPVEGTITRKELDYLDIWQALPLYNIPAGTRTRVRIKGRNDTSETQRMGIYWFVADDDGLVVQEYEKWEAWPYTGPGAEIPFTGSGFDLDKPGKYTTWVELLMNPGDPEVVDRYIGDLCTVEAVVEEYAGRITRKELDYDAVRVPFPVQ